MEQEGCLCHECKKLYRVDLVVPDVLWKDLGLDHTVMLCGSCIMVRVETKASLEDKYGYLIIDKKQWGLA